MDELKPCPFCGGRVHIEKYRPGYSFEDHYRFFHTCKSGKKSLASQVNINSNGYRTFNEARDAWNGRFESDGTAK